MSNKHKSSEPQQKKLTTSEMKQVVTKITRRQTELLEFKTETLNDSDDSRLVALESSLDQLLIGIFGEGSSQYYKYSPYAKLYPTSFAITRRSPSVNEIRERVKKSIEEVIGILESIKKEFQEVIDDAAGDPSLKVINAYRDLNLHPVVSSASSKLYLDGHYANAVEDAVKALNKHVRIKSGADSTLDGTELMERAFGCGKAPSMPMLKITAMQDENDRKEQRGFMDLFRGAVLALRNPRAHKIIIDDPETSLEYIAFISLLAKLTDKAT